MLDSPKAQAVYRALQSSGAFNSSAGDKASRAISKSTDLQGQLGVLATLPKEGLPPGGRATDHRPQGAQGGRSQAG